MLGAHPGNEARGTSLVRCEMLRAVGFQKDLLPAVRQGSGPSETSTMSSINQPRPIQGPLQVPYLRRGGASLPAFSPNLFECFSSRCLL